MNFKSTFNIAKFPLAIAMGLIACRIPTSEANLSGPNINMVIISYTNGELDCYPDGSSLFLSYQTPVDKVVGYLLGVPVNDGEDQEITLVKKGGAYVNYDMVVESNGDDIANVSDSGLREFEKFSNGKEIDITGTPHARLIGKLARQANKGCWSIFPPF